MWLWQQVKTFWHDDEGAAATEFAIVLPWLMILIYGNMHFRELILTKYFVVKLARYAAFEYTKRPLSHNNDILHEFINDHVINSDAGTVTLSPRNEFSLFQGPMAGGIRGTSGSYDETGTLGVEKIALRAVMLVPWITQKGFSVSGFPISESIIGSFFTGDPKVPDDGEKELIAGDARILYTPRWSALPLLVGQDSATGEAHSLETSGSAILIGGDAGDSYGRFAILVGDWKCTGGNHIDASSGRDEGAGDSNKARVLRVWTMSPLIQNTVIAALDAVSSALSYISMALINPYDVVDINHIGADYVGAGNEMGGGTSARSNEKARDGRRVQNENWRLAESVD